MNNKIQKRIIGCVENCSLPKFAIKNMNVRIDTGAKTSSLHVDNIKKYVEAGITKVQFDIHPDIHDVDTIVTCHSKVVDIRRVKSSNGKSEQRYVIKTSIQLDEFEWDIEVTLSNRADMNYLMLLGREGMGTHFLIDPSTTFTSSANTYH